MRARARAAGSLTLGGRPAARRASTRKVNASLSATRARAAGEARVVGAVLRAAARTGGARSKEVAKGGAGGANWGADKNEQ